jgi:predicted 2-oxoglutarate/Fe(II)-dependent dioxygenase YbiX
MIFYDMARGDPGLILVETQPSPETEKAVSAISAARIESSFSPLEVFVMTRRSSEECKKFAAALGPETPILLDPSGQILTSLANAVFPGRNKPSLFAIAYNANQRVLGSVTASDQPMINACVKLVEKNRINLSNHSIAEQAPVLLIPHLLSDADCEDLIAYWRAGHDEGGVSGYQSGEELNQQDSRQKKRRDTVLSDSSLRGRVMGRVAKRLVSEMAKSFDFQDFILEPPIVACYEANRQDYFRRHRDNLSPQTASRRFALSLNLNEGYEGGDLVFPEYGNQGYRPPAGGGIVFSCAHVHEAKPVTTGERFVLLTFLHNPERRPHPWSIPAGS